jgi:hypothetical protein
MQRVVIVGLALVCVCLLFAVSGPSAQKIAPVSGAAATRPAQVEVTNFPALQQVAGTVNVGNLPAVQSVAGSVQVTNLPLDNDGNLRITGAAPDPPYRWVQLATGLPTSVAAPTVLGPFPVGGWNRARLILRVTITSGNPTQVQAFASMGGEGMFLDVGGAGVGYDPANGIPQTFVFANTVGVYGPEMMIQVVVNSADQNATAMVDQMWLYLSN